MPIHRRTDIRHELLDEIYSSADVCTAIPRFKLPPDEQNPRNAYRMVHDELLLDGNSRQNVATFCTTWMEPEIRQLMEECVDKNIIDKDEYPQTTEIEGRCVHILADLWNSPDSANTIGCSTTGSSEAAMLGGMSLKWRWRRLRRAQGKPIDKPNLVTGPVQICWHKFCRYWDVELREIPMEGDRLILSPEEVVARCDENTIGVVPTLGTTFTGQYEPVKAISEALDRLEKETGLDIPIHVDAASGGFLAPFVVPELEWDFRLPRVKSINASGHKFGLAPLGVGWLIWRDAEDLDEDLVFQVNYNGGIVSTFSLNFSRPGGAVICQYYNFLRFGRAGYGRIHTACYENAQGLAEGIAGMGVFEVIRGGDHNGLPIVCWTLKDGADVNFTLYDFADRLRLGGWLVPAYPLPSNRTDLVIQRVLIRHGFSQDLGRMLLNDIRSALAHFEKHPVTAPLSAAEAAGHDHGGRCCGPRI